MRVRFEPFSFEDLLCLDVQPRHVVVKDQILGLLIPLKGMLEGPYSWTAWDEYGRPIACCGILSDGRAWALLSIHLRRAMPAVTRAVKTALLAHPGPVTADVDESVPEAVRWARLLGFSPAGSAWRFQRSEETRP